METSKGGLLDKANSVFEIEESGVIAKHRKASSVLENSHLSVALNNISVDLGKEKVGDEGYLIGALLMVCTTTLWSIMHIATKIMYTRSPEMTGYDTVSFMGYSLVPTYYCYAKYRGVNVNFFSFEPKVKLLLVVRVAVGLLNNIVLFTGLRYVPVGKGILIFSLSPLF